jgi:hypothetical protein
LVNAYAAVRAAGCVNSFINQNVTTNKKVFGCNNLDVQDVTVTSGATLTLEASGNINVQSVTVNNNSKIIFKTGGKVNIGSNFKVELGSEFKTINIP